MNTLAWVLAAGIIGFATTAIGAGVLKLARSTFLIPYVILSSALLFGYARWSNTDVIHSLTNRWAWGLVGAIVVGALMAKNVAGQPGSETPKGAKLAFRILWWGVVYGVVDGLLLTVMPVLATQQALAGQQWSGTWYGVLLVGVLALLANAFVTVAYHLGYPEFRNKAVPVPLAGTSIMALAMLLTGNPLAAIISHTMMHVAAVLHGAEGTVQLPPHYDHAV